MSNPLFQMFGNPEPLNNNLISKFQQFRQSFQGDARQQVQNLLNSGRVSQEQYNRAVQQANELRKMINI